MFHVIVEIYTYIIHIFSYIIWPKNFSYGKNRSEMHNSNYRVMYSNAKSHAFVWQSDWLVLERRNSITNALELCLSNPSIWGTVTWHHPIFDAIHTAAICNIATLQIFLLIKLLDYTQGRNSGYSTRSKTSWKTIKHSLTLRIALIKFWQRVNRCLAVIHGYLPGMHAQKGCAVLLKYVTLKQVQIA